MPSSIQSGTITVTVGTDPSTELYEVPWLLLVRYSTYFKHVPEEDFDKCDTSSTELSECNPRAFELFVEWLNTGSCTLKTVGDAISAWSIGDYLGSPGLQNCAIEALYWHINPLTGMRNEMMKIEPAMVLQAYRSSSPQSKLRQLFALFVCTQFRAQDESMDKWAQELEDFTGEFLKDVMNVLQKSIRKFHFLEAALKKPETLYEMPE
ncbi:hypothetical protein EV356DRAFT_577998 [Viridothelium virens]|uniref:BTB domain-containing protein n=1 Tax=Viridothelium virens TaxID=1048519 RepID=A0A6A6H4V9_VIRVR|nr:hypothetical protein EV356DRAFT_577998 [Viridothelium virens]